MKSASKDTTSKIRDMARKAADEKIAADKAKLETAVTVDLEIIEKILAMVKDRLIYKVFSPQYGKKTYVVVTEEMVLADYTTKNERSYSHGTAIERVEASWGASAYTRIKVNGHIYYHAGDLFTKYKEEADTAAKKAQKEWELASERKGAIEELLALEPVVKEIMLNYQKHLSVPTSSEGE